MWLCEAKPQESIVKIGQTLKRRLGIDDKVVLVSWWTGVISNVVFASRFCLALSAITTPSIRPALQPRADTPSNITSGKMAEKAQNWLKKISSDSSFWLKLVDKCLKVKFFSWNNSAASPTHKFVQKKKDFQFFVHRLNRRAQICSGFFCPSLVLPPLSLSHSRVWEKVRLSHFTPFSQTLLNNIFWKKTQLPNSMGLTYFLW